MRRAYEATDADILENVVGSRGGSTAVTAIIIDGKKLVVANVGDSRAILCRNGKAKGITIDHEPLKEKKQVENRGGFVVKLPGNFHQLVCNADFSGINCASIEYHEPVAI